MSEELEIKDLLKSIDSSLHKINTRQEVDESFKEGEESIENMKRRAELAAENIQNSFDRIHDKVFNFNVMIIGVFSVLGSYPSETPMIDIRLTLFPVFILIYLIWLDYHQMEIHRFASNQMSWTMTDSDEYGKKIRKQTLRSLFGLFLSFICFVFVLWVLLIRL